jgi:hydroxyethylthiazole kinase-like uncharacterized protein yjeF
MRPLCVSYAEQKEDAERLASFLLKEESKEKFLVLCDDSPKGQLGRKVGEILKGSRETSVLNPASLSEIPKGETNFCLLDAVSRLEPDGVAFLDKLPNKKISLLWPCGLNPANGQGKNVLASGLTLSVRKELSGLYLQDGLDYCGEKVLVGPAEASEINLCEEEDFLSLLPRRKENSNKGDFGRSLILGGSSQYAGAPLLSALSLSSFRLGAGYSYLCIPESIYPLVGLKHPQVIVKAFKEKEGRISYDENFLGELCSCSSALSCGMGMGVSEDVYQTVSFLIRNFSGFLTIDADGLNSIAKSGTEVLKAKKGELVLTPHIGEFSRLSGLSKEEILSDPLGRGREYASSFHLILALKSASTVVTDGKQTYISAFGNSGLAKAGSGDMLSGLLAGCGLYRSLSPLKRVLLACYLLGAASEKAAEIIGDERCLAAEDIVSALPSVLKGCEQR